MQTDLIAGREINLLQTFQENLVQSWKFTYEGCVYRDGNRIHAALCDGYTVVFE